MLMTIIKKELKRVFTDRRIVFSAFILPALSIFVLYSLMGNLMDDRKSKIEEHPARVTLVNVSKGIKDYYEVHKNDYNMVVTYADQLTAEDKIAVKEGERDLMVIFPTDFDEAVEEYRQPDIHSLSNPAEDYSVSARQIFDQVFLVDYKNQILNRRFGDLTKLIPFTLDQNNNEPYISKAETGGLLGGGMANFLPMLLMLILFAGAMGIGMDTIAGEKERGTMATLLLTPVNRNSLALGKLISLGIVAIISAATTLLAIVLSMPKILKNQPMAEVAVTGQMSFGLASYLQILVTLLLQVGIYVGLICLVSVMAKSVKEAGTYVSPVYMLVMVMAFTTMFTFGDVPLYRFAIPILGNIYVLKEALIFKLSWAEFGLASVASVVTIGILVHLITRAFNSEKIMLNA